jgi:hypothetical protein
MSFRWSRRFRSVGLVVALAAAGCGADLSAAPGAEEVNVEESESALMTTELTTSKLVTS